MNNLYKLEELNDVQCKAVTAPPANLLVLAGAGSGKTRVLVHRIAWLIQNRDISPFNILAVTFTNKAAREMRSRLEQLLNIPLENMWVGTFHGLAHRLLRLHWQTAGLPQSFQILDAEDQQRLIKRVHKSSDLDEEKWPVKYSQWFINAQKNEGSRAKHLQNDRSLQTETLIRVYRDYEETCNRGGLVDFAELLLRSHELWLNNAELLEHYRNRFKHILVDEFQDTNTIQYAWLQLLAGKQSYLTAVGDDDQSIYGWRGAKIENIHRVSKDFTNTKIIRLEQNYRSTNNILSAANAVIANNANRLGKKLWSSGRNGELISLYPAFNEIDEAKFIVNTIKKRQQETVEYSDFAVLYRSNAQSRVIEEQLIQAGIPYRVYGGLKFFERAEIKDTLAYLRLLVRREDDSAFERIVNFPTRGIGDTTLACLRQYAHNNNIALWTAAKNGGLNLSARATNAVNGFLQLIDDMAKETENLALDEQVEHVLHRTSLREYFTEDKTERGQNRLENLDELVVACRQFKPEGKTPAILQAFLAHAALEAGENQAETDGKCVQLMTLHSAKGLEFPVVFISGMEAGLFPHRSSFEDYFKLEEERRLCYVGMTRAMQKLYLTYAQNRKVYGAESFRRPSTFLLEVPKNLIEEVQPLISFIYPQFNSDNKSTSNISNDTGLQLGQRVSHKKFGEGYILNFEGSGEYARVQVKFDRFGTKWLVAAYAGLM